MSVASMSIWTPSSASSIGWHWQLSTGGNLNVTSLVAEPAIKMVDIDLFDTNTTVISTLKSAGKKVICYFSAGSYENWRSDASSFPAAVIGKGLQGWKGEKWLDIRGFGSSDGGELGRIMKARMDLAVQKACDGVEPDNVDGYINPTGFPLTSADQLDYNRWLAVQAHARNLSIGLKNDLDQIPDLVNYFDWALNEECYKYSECNKLTPFKTAGKAVFGVEYTDKSDTSTLENLCSTPRNLGFNWLVARLSLGGWAYDCTAHIARNFGTGDPSAASKGIAAREWKNAAVIAGFAYGLAYVLGL
ncbi:hypothetical protein SpCBS45565_g02652 [Spizellomyces sp. 'palustris']|nr:hypothetical protein SpCBS45565_g02652 [Spizellomyces sp. 'palustris']